MFTVNDYLTFRIHGGAGTHRGGFADQLGHFLKDLETLMAKDSGEIFSVIMPGFNSLANIHPLLVHFPIAFLTAFLVFDIAGSLFRNHEWRRFAGWFLYLGAASAILTVAAGFQAAATVAHSDAVHQIMERHKQYAITVTSLAVFLSVWRFIARGYFGIIANILYLSLAALMCLIMALGADLGGLMVYNHGVGVAAVKQSSHNHDHAHSHDLVHTH